VSTQEQGRATILDHLLVGRSVREDIRTHKYATSILVQVIQFDYTISKFFLD